MVAVKGLSSTSSRSRLYFPFRFTQRTTICRGRRRRRGNKLLPLTTLSIVVVVLITNSTTTTNDNSNNNGSEPLWTSCPRISNIEAVSSTGNLRGEKENENNNRKESNDDICFITCIFGENVQDVDQPANVDWFNGHWCHVRFLLVTNLSDLPSPGWTKIVTPSSSNNVTVAVVATDTEASATASIVNLNNDGTILTTTKNNIVQSRHAKFVAWDVLPDIVPNNCAAVVYMDGYLTPVRYTSLWSLLSSIISSPFSSFFTFFCWLLGDDDGQHRQYQVPPPLKFQNLIRQVRNHPWGLTQVKQTYFNGLPMTTLLRNLIRDRKDTTEHVEATLRWFHARPDFREITPYYLNKYFAYDPNNAKYRELSLYFWEIYTTYGGIWRDQPLWSYVLDHFNITPSIMTTEGTITKGGDLFRTGGRLGWGKHVYVP
mmetsp:Transcript_45393/g.50883  ORF Transcript_45393/g.50883 Transcript_45393/m.50883 type:complete len:429 (+) Transcript_45393:29-1315(+)